MHLLFWQKHGFPMVLHGLVSVQGPPTTRTTGNIHKFLSNRHQKVANRNKDNRMNRRCSNRGLSREEQTLGARRNGEENAGRQNEEQETSDKERYHYT